MNLKLKQVGQTMMNNTLDRKGITLIELVMTMVLMGIVALVVANALSTGVTAFFTTDNRKESLDQGRIALDRMAKEIRNLRDSDDVNASSATQFCFTDTEGVQINYSYAGTNLRRATGNCTAGSGATLSANITSFSFDYIRADGTVDASFVDTDPDNPATDTKKIRITLTSTASGESVSLETEVWPRNL